MLRHWIHSAERFANSTFETWADSLRLRAGDGNPRGLNPEHWSQAAELHERMQTGEGE